MSNTNTGGPAFSNSRYAEVFGMTLRDYFAAKAMHASMTADPANEAEADSHARWAYVMADAMLKARGA